MGAFFVNLVVFLALTLFSQSGQAQINRIYDPILVSQKVYVSPHRVCHDGLFLHFTTRAVCEKEGIPGMECDVSRQIAPIRSAEKIFLEEGGEDHVTRFYHIPLRYRYQEVDIKQDITLVNEVRTIGTCPWLNRVFETENVRYSRTVRTPEERAFVASLVRQAKLNRNENFLLLNTPIGNMSADEVLSLEDPSLSEEDLLRATVKTPLCNDGYSADKVWQMSGEYTGSGIRDLMPAALQTISRPLFVRQKRWVVDEVTGQLELRYEFSCEKVWEI